MDANQIREILLADLSGCEIKVEGGDGKYLVSATGEIFEGLNAVKRQQLIYGILGSHIASGAIHAVTMKLQTESERGSA